VLRKSYLLLERLLLRGVRVWAWNYTTFLSDETLYYVVFINVASILFFHLLINK
jgi:hypothetical protein